MRYLPLAVFLIPAFLSGAARARTAEEAIAYVFLGLADGAKLQRGMSSMTWKETGSSPATYDGVWMRNGRTTQISIAVTATNNCDYVVRIAGPPDLVPHGSALYARVEMKKVTSIVPRPDAVGINVTGTGYCETSPENEDCRPTDISDLFGAVEPIRHQETVTFIRSKICANP
jgi:hypothetical protein